MTRNTVRASGGAVRVDVLVVPNASRSEIVGLHGDRVRIRVSSPPEKGRANKELMTLLINATGATRATVVVGGASRRKTVELTGVETTVVRACLVRDM